MDSDVHFIDEIPRTISMKVEIDEERLDLEDTFAEAEKLELTIETNAKCGDVIFGSRGKLTIVCVLCMDVFKDLEKFGIHLQEDHISRKSLNEFAGFEDSIQRIQNEEDSLSDSNSATKEFIKKETIECYHDISEPLGSVGEMIKLYQTNEKDESNNYVVRPLQESVPKMYSCQLCEATYSHYRTYLAHARRKHGILNPKFRSRLQKLSGIVGYFEKVDIESSECATLESEEILNNAVKKEFACNQCKCSYAHNRSLLSHIRKHHGNADFNGTRADFPDCKVSNLEDKESVLEQGKKEPMSTSEAAEKYECHICDRSYAHNRSLQSHIRKHHGDSYLDGTRPDSPDGIDSKLEDEAKESEELNLKPILTDDATEVFKCHFCDRVYSHKRSLVSHIRVVHTEDSLRKPKTCKYCLKVFEKLQAYKKHINDDHPGDKKYLCPHCPKYFTSNYIRRNHIYTHTGERPFKCTRCPQAFSNSSNLAVHIRLHLNIKNYPCSFCGKPFISGSQRRRHERSHTGEKLHQCEECGNTYHSLYKLKEHLLKHQNIRNFECEVCNKRFFTITRLKDHMRSHSNERPYSCKVCGQSFARRKALKVHEHLHSDVKKFVCTTCGKAFSQHAGLYSHRKTHAKI